MICIEKKTVFHFEDRGNTENFKDRWGYLNARRKNKKGNGGDYIATEDENKQGKK
jgi:hypothetical protein